MKHNLRKRILVLATILTMLICVPTVNSCATEVPKEDPIQTIVQNMTLRQKIAQCLMMDFRKWNDAEGEAQNMTRLAPEVKTILEEYQFGAVILFAENIQKTGDTVALTKEMQDAATAKGGLPLLIATDQEGGIVYRLGSGTALPGNMALAATGDSNNARLAGEIIGRELESVGINTTLAPVIDVNNNANNPVIGLRSFSDDANLVGEYGAQYIKGLNAYDTIGCAKHFPGHGDTDTDSHTGLPEVKKSLDQLKNNELKPYTIAIDKGIDMIMSAHILYPGLDDTTVLSEKTGKEERRPATLSHKILTDLLRNDMGFQGVVVTDAMNMEGISKRFSMGQATTEALKAGADLVCMPLTGITDKTQWTSAMAEILGYVENAVAKGDLTEARLDEAVTRVLTLKQKKGILDYDASQYTQARANVTVGSEQNRKLEREISAKAVTVIQNRKSTLPATATKDTRVLMMAPYENELAQMVMGFNRVKKAGLVPKATEVEIYCYSEGDYEIEGDLKEALDWADVVLMNSEVSRATRLTGEHWTSAGPMAYTRYCKEHGKKSIVLSVDKPYDVQIYPDADAVMAVYGWKGSDIKINGKLMRGDLTAYGPACGPNIVAGVEVAFGVFGASGKLPVNVPALDKANKVYTDQVKYPRGYGLTYKARRPEAKSVPATPAPDLKKAAIKSVKAKKKALKVKLRTKPSARGGTHYQIAFKLKSDKKWKYKTTTKAKITLKKLKRHKKYVVKARVIKKMGGKTYYGAWSKKKIKKVK